MLSLNVLQEDSLFSLAADVLRSSLQTGAVFFMSSWLFCVPILEVPYLGVFGLSAYALNKIIAIFPSSV